MKPPSAEGSSRKVPAEGVSQTECPAPVSPRSSGGEAGIRVTGRALPAGRSRIRGGTWAQRDKVPWIGCGAVRSMS